MDKIGEAPRRVGLCAVCDRPRLFYPFAGTIPAGEIVM